MARASPAPPSFHSSPLPHLLPSAHPCFHPQHAPVPAPSILGMHLFGCKFSLKTDTGDTVPDRKNFDSLLWAIVTVFQVVPRGARSSAGCRVWSPERWMCRAACPELPPSQGLAGILGLG